MITSLLVKTKRGAPLEPRDEIELDMDGIVGGVPCSPLRHLLMLPETTIREFDLMPGDLRENVIMKDIDIHSIESGRILYIGSAHVRVTFHCEPCSVIKDKVNLRAVQHKRGVLGSVVRPGLIRIGDSIIVGPQMYEEIPYNLKDRVKWYIDKCDAPIHVVDLVGAIGLSKSYCRVMPGIVKSRNDIDPEMILYGEREQVDERQMSLKLK